MRLSSMSNNFVFNLPSDFLSPQVVSEYQPVLEKNFVQYENVIDYLNSTIKSIDFPGFNMPKTPNQVLPRGKKIYYSDSVPGQDLIASHDLTITFRSVDADLNYFIMADLLLRHYEDVNKLFVNPFTLSALDIFRDAIYILNFRQIIYKDLSSNKFDYSQQKIQPKEFTCTFNFNFIDIEFVLNKSKILENNTASFPPTIIQKR